MESHELHKSLALVEINPLPEVLEFLKIVVLVDKFHLAQIVHSVAHCGQEGVRQEGGMTGWYQLPRLGQVVVLEVPNVWFKDRLHFYYDRLSQ